MPSIDRTRVAPSTRLRYRVARAERTGSAELRWEVTDGAYEARLEIVFDAPTRTQIQQISRGRIDASGVAPERYTDQRPRGAMLAANFERTLGEVSFSGPSWRVALAPGAQDGLSWLLQLAAVVEAEPQRAAPGGEVVIPVIGVRGAGRDWRFRFEPGDASPVGAGDAAGPRPLRWVREPTELHDTRVEVWLDPARHHLPVRWRTGPASGAATLELTLDE